MGIGRIQNKFTKLQKSKQKGLIAYLTIGDPNLEISERFLELIAKSGADIIELGVPYADPLADGPVIQYADEIALNSGTNLVKVIDLAARIGPKIDIPIILMSYFNPILQYGPDLLINNSSAIGIDGFIIPDLPLEESRNFSLKAKKKGCAYIPLVAPTTTPSRLRKISQIASGFVYCVSVTGITGMRQNVSSELPEFIKRVRKNMPNMNLAIGFGISNPEQASIVGQIGDAVIVGSAIMKIINQHGEFGDKKTELSSFISSLKKALV